MISLITISLWSAKLFGPPGVGRSGYNHGPTPAGSRPRKVVFTTTPSITLLWFGGRISSLSRSEEHTSELQSRQYIVCRLLLEKKKASSPTTKHSATSRMQVN